MKFLFVCIVLSMTLVSFYTNAAEKTIKMSPYRSSNSMLVTTTLLQVPLKLSYNQLNSEEKSIFRNIYSDISDSIEPPFPQHGLRRILDPIYYAQNKLREQGVLYVVAIVDNNGQVQKVEIYKTPSKEMSKKVASVLFKTKFKPALCSSSPCQYKFPLVAKFSS